MSKLLAVVFALSTFTALAQEQAQPPAPPAGSSWKNVEALPIGISIYVRPSKGGKRCRLRSGDADTLTCNDAKQTVFQRSDIKTVKLVRRGRSVLVGLGVGAGAGAILGVATGGCSTAQKQSFLGCFFTPSKPEAAAAGALFFGGVGALVGLSDFTRSTVYRAP